MANVINGQFINWSAMTGSQIRAKVAELQKLAKLQEKAPEKAAAKIAKAVTAKPAKKAAAKPAKKAAAKPAVSRKSTTEKRIRAMKWIPLNVANLEKTAAIAAIMSEFGVPKNYASNWLKLATA